MYQFAFPWTLLLLLLPVLLWLWRRRGFARPFLSFSLTHRLSPLKSPGTDLWIKWHGALPYLAMILMILALARPQRFEKETQVLSEGIDLILAIDVSESMAALDFELEGKPVNRLTVVKKVVRDFISKQVGNRLGMVLFGEAAYTQSPITLDYEVLIQLLNQAKIGMAGNGTAVGEGLALSVKRLKDLESKSKVVI
ncbi:MAG: VWA domain-containing protein, partial [Deltaproteobacteria bacterium]|nr:VWA domain-containing protein [Deltaproteobacteria bacterium]